MNVLVTGGAGFIGSNLVRRLLDDGHAVTVLDDFSTGRRENLAPVRERIRLVEGDLRDRAACAAACAGAEVAFHLGALGSVPRSVKDPQTTHAVNVDGTVNLLEAMRAAGTRRIVFSSSSSVYGDTPTLPKAEPMEPLPRSPYAASKLAAEQYVCAYARGGLLEGVSLRYFNIFGPNQSPHVAYAAVIPLWMAAARDGTEAVVFGDGEQTRDFTFVANAVEANVRAATLPPERVNGWVVNCGAGGRTSLNTLLALIERVSGRPVRRRHEAPRAGDVRDSLASLERAERVLGYAPLVDVEAGLARTWAALVGAA